MSQSSCPDCGANNSARRDDSPAQVSVALGCALILYFIWSIRPAEANIYDIMLRVISLLLFYGVAVYFLHGNRYCCQCGRRFRLPFASNLLMLFTKPQKSYFPSKESVQAERERPLDPNTPIPPLLNCLTMKTPGVAEEAAHTLKRLTGQDFGVDVDKWRNWYREHKQLKNAPTPESANDHENTTEI